jgi:putative glutamine amidotransferase
VIGISAMAERASWGHWRDVPVNISQRTYSTEVARSGGVPVLLAAHDEVTQNVDALLDRLDGLIVAGGADIDPGLYGESAEPETTTSTAERDRFELALMRAAIERDMPMLGVCRGMELLNVACGGTLEQHLPDAETHLRTPGVFTQHDVELEAGSLAARAAGSERVAVCSHHHQGIGKLGAGLRVSGRADPGGADEAIEMDGRGFVLGTLWHSEEEPGSSVVAALVEAARNSRTSPGREAEEAAL